MGVNAERVLGGKKGRREKKLHDQGKSCHSETIQELRNEKQQEENRRQRNTLPCFFKKKKRRIAYVN